MSDNSFPYSYWFKILGLLMVLAGIVFFARTYFHQDRLDFNDLSVGMSWGLVFIFFSRERQDDEMIHSLKYKALTRAIIIVFFITQSYNYIFLNWNFKRGRDTIQSISAYQFMALALLVATGYFYLLRYLASKKGAE